MARVLTCVDPSPASDGTCVQTVWLDQSDWTTYLPSLEQAGQVGAVYFAGLMSLAVMKGLLFPKDNNED